MQRSAHPNPNLDAKPASYPGVSRPQRSLELFGVVREFADVGGMSHVNVFSGPTNSNWKLLHASSSFGWTVRILLHCAPVLPQEWGRGGWSATPN